MWTGNDPTTTTHQQPSHLTHQPPQPQPPMHEYHQHQHIDFTQTYEQTYEQHGGGVGGDMSIGMDFSQVQPQSCVGEMDMHHGMHQYAPGLDALFDSSYGAGNVTGHVSAVDYQYNDMIHEYH